MSTLQSTQPTIDALDDPPVPVRTKLAAAWTSFMFLYAYVDILGFYTPGTVEDILDGKVYEFDLSQTFSTTVLAVLAVPIFMVVLSTTLPARPNRLIAVRRAMHSLHRLSRRYPYRYRSRYRCPLARRHHPGSGMGRARSLGASSSTSPGCSDSASK